MNTRCKPGDLAVVVQAQNPANLGLIVKVLAPYGQATEFAAGGMVWDCECAQPMTWVRGGRATKARSGPVPDALLQPIRGAHQGSPARASERSRQAA